MSRQDHISSNALKTLQEDDVLMLDGHFDDGNGYHGRDYVNPHGLLRHPSLIWRLGQDLLDVLPETVVIEAAGLTVIGDPRF